MWEAVLTYEAPQIRQEVVHKEQLEKKGNDDAAEERRNAKRLEEAVCSLFKPGPDLLLSCSEAQMKDASGCSPLSGCSCEHGIRCFLRLRLYQRKEVIPPFVLYHSARFDM